MQFATLGLPNLCLFGNAETFHKNIPLRFMPGVVFACDLTGNRLSLS